MKFAVVVITGSGNAQCFREVGETLVHGIRALGYECADLLWQQFLPDVTHIVLAWNMIEHVPTMVPPPGSVLYNLEQILPGLTDFGRVVPWLGNPNYRIWDYSLSNISALKTVNVNNVTHVPIGYYDGLTCAPVAEEDIDVVFTGNMNERRQRMWQRLIDKRWRVAHISGTFGVERDRWIARGRVHLNMHWWFPQCVFEEVRCSYLLANRAVVVSENGDPNGESTYRDVIQFCNYDEIPSVIERVLSTDRQALKEQGLTLVRSRRVETILDIPLRSL